MRNDSLGPDDGSRTGRFFRLPLTHAGRIRADADDELDAFLDERVADLVARGMTPAAARREAIHRLGGSVRRARSALRASAEQREGRMRLRTIVDDLAQDLRHTARQFRKAPAFATIAIVTLALGIGANTAIFSVVRRMLLSPLPYPDGDRIVALGARQVDGSFFPGVSGQMLDAWQQRSRTVEMFGVSNERKLRIPEASVVDTIVGSTVSPDFVRLVSARPTAGRMFEPRDAAPDAPPVAMISDRLWRERFGSRRDVIGSTIHINERVFTVVGVTRMHSELPRPSRNLGGQMLIPWTVGNQPDVWIPARFNPQSLNVGDLFAKLRPGVSAEAAARELDAIMQSVGDTTLAPRTTAGVMHSQDFLDPKEVRTIQVLFLAVGLLVLIACVNVANLLLARTWSRRREIAVRITLGAGRSRLLRQLLTESLTLSLTGGALGLLLALQALRLLAAAQTPASAANAPIVRPDAGVLLWSLGLSVATGVLFSLAPALLSRASSVGDALRNDTRTTSGNAAARRSRAALVVAEVALSLVLLVGAGLLIRAFLSLQRTPLGFDPAGLVSIGVVTPPQAISIEQRSALRESVLERVRGVPGVTSVAAGTMPGTGMIITAELKVENNNAPKASGLRGSTNSFVSSDFFRVVRVPLISGRLFDSTSADDRNEMVINRSLADKLWPNGNAVGSRLRLFPRSPWKTVIGVVGDIRIPGVAGGRDEIQTYTPPVPQVPFGAYVIRTSLPPDALAPTLKKTIASVDPRLIVANPTTGHAYIRQALAPARFAMGVLVAFAIVALTLSMIGLYGVISYAVTQRTREIGIRIALGAERRAITRLVVGDGLRLIGVGLVVGLAAAAAASRVLGSMLYGMSPTDPLTYAAVAALVVAIALLASYAPARRALRIDPTDALRAD